MSGNGESQMSGPQDGAASHGHVDGFELSARHSLESILDLVEAAKTQTESVTDNQRQSAAAAMTAQEKLSEIGDVAAQIIALKIQVTDDQKVIAAKSAHIQSAQEHADKVRSELDRTLTSATQQLTEAEGFKSRAQSASDIATELLASVRTAKGAVDTDAAAVQAAREKAGTAADEIRGLADKAETVEQRVSAYETALADLKSRCDAQLQTIVSLLPGATSAGLAHAFDQRRQTFMKPRVRWQWLFVGSVLALVVLASTGLWHVYSSGTTMTYDDLLRLWLSRLPVAGALVWLAVHASRESALAKRLEEDYGYKAAIASSFEGFHKQMTEVGGNVAANSPLATLCQDTLATIAAPPGRIYEAHRLTVTPATELTGAVRDAMASPPGQH
jgi:hypothetical protein